MDGVLIKQVILGLLSETPLTGYDLKKRVSSSMLLPWSGNSNQIYKALLELHEEGLVSVEEQQQMSKPPRKLYTLTEQGHQALRQWLQSTPDIAQFQSPLLVQLLWADQVEQSLLCAMLEQYVKELSIHITMLREQVRRQTDSPAHSQDSSLVIRAMQHWIDLYEFHLQWIHKIRQSLPQTGETNR
jgi:PadR family transcriptional regulator, regulatory protein AphA